jgi:hypothetical protein
VFDRTTEGSAPHWHLADNNELIRMYGAISSGLARASTAWMAANRTSMRQSEDLELRVNTVIENVMDFTPDGFSDLCLGLRKQLYSCFAYDLKSVVVETDFE